LGEEYRSCSSSLLSFIHSPVISSIACKMTHLEFGSARYTGLTCLRAAASLYRNWKSFQYQSSYFFDVIESPWMSATVWDNSVVYFGYGQTLTFVKTASVTMATERMVDKALDCWWEPWPMNLLEVQALGLWLSWLYAVVCCTICWIGEWNTNKCIQ
jgi:hypothetical protein